MTVLRTKIMMLGEIGVGKTSIVRRLIFDTFDASYKATIGVDIHTYLLHDLDPKVELLVWDVDGDLGPTIFNHIYLRGAGGAFIVSDATRAATYQTALGLVDGFGTNLPGRPKALLINKIDLLSPDQPPEMKAGALDVDVFWTSALSGYRVREVFNRLGRQCVENGYAV
jgi:GTPase SAR1 family protein